MERCQHREAGPQLLLPVFLQRIVDGCGRIERDYGRMHTEVLISWPGKGDREDT